MWKLDRQTDHDIFEGVASACTWATEATPTIMPHYHYDAIKRLADAGDGLAKEWLPRVRRGTPPG